MKKNENIPEEELRISDQDHTMDSENEIARKMRIKHRRGPRKKKEKRRISKAAKKRIAITCGSIVGIVAVAYFGGVIFFQSHFYPGTTINGNSFSLRSVHDAEDYMAEQVAGYTLTLNEKDGGTETISGKDIDISYQESGALEKVKEEQNPFLWPTALWTKSDVTTEVGIEYNEEKLAGFVSMLKCVTSAGQTASENAHPVYDGNQFVIQEEVVGNQVNQETLLQKVKESVSGFNQEMNLETEGCYITPAYTKDSPEVQAAVDTMNKYLQSKITYDLSPKTEVVDKTLISQWLTVDENMQVTFNTDQVNAYIAQLATKYNTVGTTRTFVTGRGDTVQVSGGDFGWYLNQEDEYAALVANIQSGEEVSREPKWSRRGADHGDDNDYGDTYAEVDLTTQKFWFFQNGEVIMNCDIVSGTPNGEDDTPQGSYDLTYKTKNAVLRGELLANGEYSYESPVAFWMPFNGDIGFHDASWQTRFGGDWYLNHGSHGCINMKYDDAAKLYDLINETTPIICHF